MGMMRFLGISGAEINCLIDKIFPVKSMVKLYSLHKKISKSATDTSVKLLAMLICFNCEEILIFTLWIQQ